MGASSCLFDQDKEDIESFHLGYFNDGEEKTALGIASFYKEPLDNYEGNGWRLRGMAVDQSGQGKGLGTKLLTHGTNLLKEVHGSTYLWCDARRVAYNFYQAFGFIYISDEFLIPGIGPHRKMLLRLTVPNTK